MKTFILSLVLALAATSSQAVDVRRARADQASANARLKQIEAAQRRGVAVDPRQIQAAKKQRGRASAILSEDRNKKEHQRKVRGLSRIYRKR
jgi:Ni/Co efflux regulator RcnB